jgi:hypothetical protein
VRASRGGSGLDAGVTSVGRRYATVEGASPHISAGTVTPGSSESAGVRDT